MKKYFKQLGIVVFSLVLFCGVSITAQAQEEYTIKDGIYISGMDMGGMTAQEAEVAIEDYVNSIKPAIITLNTANGGEVQITAGDLGLTWVNREIVEEAAGIGQEGNVIVRYKMMKDLQQDNINYELELSFDEEAIRQILEEKCVKYNSEAVNASLSRVDGAFVVEDGQSGYALNVEGSTDAVYDYMLQEWDHQPATIALVVDEILPMGTTEELSQITDVLGSFTTSYSSSGTARSANVANGCALINGITLYPGEEFSTLDAITPFTKENGYYPAASYANGRVVDSLGGGICQVSTTLYNAVLLAELEVTERYNHSMIVAYVDPSADAAIAESADKDFCFINNTDHPIYIEGITKNKKLTINIYGVETRSSNREIEYVSEVLQRISPSADVIYVDEGQPIGYIATESAHVGYKAKLWKVVKENGVEVERTEVNYSSYKMTPRYATVGVATADPYAREQIMAAVGTSNIDHVRNIIAMLTTPPAQ